MASGSAQLWWRSTVHSQPTGLDSGRQPILSSAGHQPALRLARPHQSRSRSPATTSAAASRPPHSHLACDCATKRRSVPITRSQLASDGVPSAATQSQLCSAPSDSRDLRPRRLSATTASSAFHWHFRCRLPARRVTFCSQSGTCLSLQNISWPPHRHLASRCVIGPRPKHGQARRDYCQTSSALFTTLQSTPRTRCRPSGQALLTTSAQCHLCFGTFSHERAPARLIVAVLGSSRSSSRSLRSVSSPPQVLRDPTSQ